MKKIVEMNFIEKIDGYKPIYKGIPPFMKYEKGFGYFGVLLEEEKTGKLQCHLCGISVLNIAQHLRHKHSKMSARDYRIKVGLSLTTPLMSESTRKKIKNNFLYLPERVKEKRIKMLRILNKRLHSNPKKQRENKASLQVNNRYGTCPDQVKSQFLDIYTKLGRIPNWRELTGKLRYIIETRFGSYEEAIVVWGIPRAEYKIHMMEWQNKAQKIRTENNYYPKYTIQEVKKQYMDFFAIKKRLPTWGEVVMNGMASRGTFEKVFGINKSTLERQLNYR